VLRLEPTLLNQGQSMLYYYYYNLYTIDALRDNLWSKELLTFKSDKNWTKTISSPFYCEKVNELCYNLQETNNGIRWRIYTV